MIVSVPLLLLLYFLFVLFLSPFLVFLFFALCFVEGHFYYFYTFVLYLFGMEVEDENGMLIEYFRCYFFPYTYIRDTSSNLGLLLWTTLLGFCSLDDAGLVCYFTLDLLIPTCACDVSTSASAS